MTEVTALAPNSITTTPPHHLKVVSGFGYDETLQRLRLAIDAADLWVIHEIDPQALLKRGGFSITSLRQLLWFHPRFMARLLMADPGAVPEAPLKFVVSSEPTGVVVRALDPVVVFSPYAGLSTLADELLDLTKQMLTSVTPDVAM